MNLFVTGIGTNVGKTIVAAILTEGLQANYWKPIQSGTIEGNDSDTLKQLISNSKTIIYPESYLLKQPLSPNIAAKIDGIEINLKTIQLPSNENNSLIIEGAGGLLVPINKTNFVIDIAKKFNSEIVLVISNYLGCINHTLLSINYLKQNNFKIYALVFNGNFNDDVKQSIINYAPLTKVIEIPTLKTLSKKAILAAAKAIDY